jgi:multidrug efflux pump
VLSAQFESFRDPLIILLALPTWRCSARCWRSTCLGTLGGQRLELQRHRGVPRGRATISIYTQVGLVTLVGLISKHGILIVEFANKLPGERPLLQAARRSRTRRRRPLAPDPDDDGGDGRGHAAADHRQGRGRGARASRWAW